MFATELVRSAAMVTTLNQAPNVPFVQVRRERFRGECTDGEWKGGRHKSVHLPPAPRGTEDILCLPLSLSLPPSLPLSLSLSLSLSQLSLPTSEPTHPATLLHPSAYIPRLPMPHPPQPQNAKRHLDRRLTLDSTLEELMTLTLEDVVAGCAELPPCVDSSSEAGSA